MTRKLRAWVHVAGQVFKPGDVPPPEIAEQIRNPKVWEDIPEPEQAEPAVVGGAGGTPPAPVEPPPDGPKVDAPAEPVEPPATPVEPPRSGKGSGRDVWAAFADAHGVTYPADAGQRDIIAACVAAKVIAA